MQRFGDTGGSSMSYGPVGHDNCVPFLGNMTMFPQAE
jgi:hypothetical protein